MPATSFDREAMEAFLRSKGITNPRRFAAKDDDELNDAVRDGRIRHVVFVKLDDLLEAIWIGHVQYHRWIEFGTLVELVEPPPEANDWPQFVQTMAISLANHRRRKRRGQTIAAAVLSLLALAAIWVLLMLR